MSLWPASSVQEMGDMFLLYVYSVFRGLLSLLPAIAGFPVIGHETGSVPTVKKFADYFIPDEEHYFYP